MIVSARLIGRAHFGEPEPSGQGVLVALERGRVAIGDVCDAVFRVPRLHTGHAEEGEQSGSAPAGIGLPLHRAALYQFVHGEVLGPRCRLLVLDLGGAPLVELIVRLNAEPDARVHAEHTLELERGGRLHWGLASHDLADELRRTAAAAGEFRIGEAPRRQILLEKRAGRNSVVGLVLVGRCCHVLLLPRQ